MLECYLLAHHWKVFLWRGSYKSPVKGEPVFGVCDQVRLKLACSAIQTSKRLEILDIETRGIILSKQRITMALIRLRRCTGWSALFCLHMAMKLGSKYNLFDTPPPPAPKWNTNRFTRVYICKLLKRSNELISQSTRYQTLFIRCSCRKMAKLKIL